MKYKKAAFSFSLILLLLWGCLGAGSTLAWFTDEDSGIRNVFHFADFELEVSHLVDGTWKKIEGNQPIFDDSALYEPGYVQVVYLKVENKGSVPFNFKTAVTVTGRTASINYFGQEFFLQDYLRFGLVVKDSETELLSAADTRTKAAALATNDLCDYATEYAKLEAGDTKYIALVVSMPEEVDNRANYRKGSAVPTVELGVTVTAEQVKS